MLKSAFAAGLMMMLLAMPGALPAQACPSEAPGTRVLVQRFLTRPALQPVRLATGLAGADTSQIRLLSNGADDSVCQQLNTAVGSSTGQSGPWRWSYYTAAGRLIVALQYVDAPGTRRVGFVPLYVYDTSPRLLGTYAM